MAVESTLATHVEDVVARVAQEFPTWEVYTIDELYKASRRPSSKQQLYLAFGGGDDYPTGTLETWVTAEFYAYMRVPMKGHPSPVMTCAGNAVRLAAWIDKRGFAHSGAVTIGHVMDLGVDDDPNANVEMKYATYQVHWTLPLQLQGEGTDEVGRPVQYFYREGGADIAAVHVEHDVDGQTRDQVID